MNNPILSRLGIARKAGKLSIGTQSVFNAIEKRAAQLIIVSSDISVKTEKELRFKSKQNITVLRVPFKNFEIANAVGVKAGIVSVNDSGFAEAIKKQISISAETEEMNNDC